MDTPIIDTITTTARSTTLVNTCAIYIAHAGDAPEQVEGLRRFLGKEVIARVAASTPVRTFRTTSETKLAIFERIVDVDIVVLLITEGLSRSPWLVEELRIARALGKRLIAVRTRQASEGAAEASAQGVRARMVDCRVLDLAEERDRDAVVEALLSTDTRASLLLNGVDLANLRSLQARLDEQGASLDLDDLSLTEVLLWDLGGSSGAVLWNSMLARSEILARRLAQRAGLARPRGGALRPIRARLRRLGPIFMLSAATCDG